ncbi:MAG: T9SS type A sorting domain-containing protein [Chitinophagaceae bacterium]|nr:T9SS type A sorting domain-containing protein [Chitinophagaceae bacterium]
MFKLLLLCIAVFFGKTILTAQNFVATYSFANTATTSGRVDPTPSLAVGGIDFGHFVAVAPNGNPNTLSDNPNASGRFSFAGWPRGATNGSDNFTGSFNADQYYEVVISPETYYTLQFDSIKFTVQRSGTGIRQYAVRSSLDGFASNIAGSINPINASLQVVGNNIFQITDATSAAQNGSKVSFAANSITSTVTLRFYGWNAESTAGTFSIDNVSVYGSATVSPTALLITVNPFSLAFASTAIGATSQNLSYSVQAKNLTEPLVIDAPAPFAVSTSEAGPFLHSVAIPAANASAENTIYVQFAPGAAGTFTDSITHTSAAATTRKVAVSGEGINPDNFTFNFNSCTDAGAPGSGFTAYSVTGQQKWGCTTFGFNNTNGISINGYSGGAQENEDWLISPPLNFSAITLPVLRFWSRGEFVGPPLHLLISTDYDGSSDPNLYTWTDLDAAFAPLTNTWTLTDGIDLTAYKSFNKVFVAFKYISSANVGASRWNIDEVDITNRTQLLSTKPAQLDFGEVSAGTISAPITFKLKAVGYGPVTLQAPAGFELSSDNLTYSSSLAVNETSPSKDTTIYARFVPADKQLKIEGMIRFTAPGLDSNRVMLTGTSYPRAETFDVGTYNLSFFGSNPTNTPTPEKIKTQVANIAIVLKKMQLDVVGVEEISNDQAFDSLVAKVPHSKGIVSNRWSYSFYGPDPNFPPQKVGMIYDCLTMKLVNSRPMFASLYDSARNGHPEKLANYPGGALNFWAGGRLPFMATFDVMINGISRQIRVITIHSKSSSDATSYNRRVYDAKVLYDTLQAYYAADNIVIVGDFNDKLSSTTYNNAASPFKNFVDDKNNYVPLTLPLELAGKVSYLGGSALIDHMIITNEMEGLYIPTSTVLEDPRNYIGGYSATTASDHLPVYSRFNLSASLPVTLLQFMAVRKTDKVQLQWSTTNEVNNQQFVVERSTDRTNFIEIATVAGIGNSTLINNYNTIDAHPIYGANYYRLKQIDIDGKFTYSGIVAVNFIAENSLQLKVYPNPVGNNITLQLTQATGNYSLVVYNFAGKKVLAANGSLTDINQRLNTQLIKLTTGVYSIQLTGKGQKTSTVFVKK